MHPQSMHTAELGQLADHRVDTLEIGRLEIGLLADLLADLPASQLGHAEPPTRPEIESILASLASLPRREDLRTCTSTLADVDGFASQTLVAIESGPFTMQRLAELVAYAHRLNTARASARAVWESERLADETSYARDCERAAELAELERQRAEDARAVAAIRAREALERERTEHARADRRGRAAARATAPATSTRTTPLALARSPLVVAGREGFLWVAALAGFVAGLLAHLIAGVL